MKYETRKQEARNYYSALKSVYCPYLKDKISFPLQSWYHILYKRGHIQRDKDQQMVRFRYLRSVEEILRYSGTLQEYEARQTLIRHNDKVVLFWGFIAIIRGKKLKVVIRQVGMGKKHFYSVIPNFVTRKFADLELKKTPVDR